MTAPPSRLRESLSAWLPILSRYLGLAALLYEPTFDGFHHSELLQIGAGLWGLPFFVEYRRIIRGRRDDDE